MEIKDKEGIYTEEKLLIVLDNIIRSEMDSIKIRKSLIQVLLELITDIDPNCQYAEAKMYTYEPYDAKSTVYANR